MFKKFVSNLPFTPSLLPQISFYAKRLSQESATRKLGVVFAGLTIIMQSVLLISPPQPSLASSNNDVIFGGVSRTESQAKQQLIDHVFRGDKAMVSPYNGKTYYDLDKLFKHFNITAEDIRNSKKVTICSQCNEQDKNKRSVGRLPNSVDATLDVKFKPAGSRYSYYLRPLHIWDSGSYSKYEALKVRDGVWILLNCGNIVVDKVPEPDLTLTKTQSPPNDSVVKPGTTVSYGFKVTNTGQAAAQNVKILDPHFESGIFRLIKVNKGEADAARYKVTIGGSNYSQWVINSIEPGETVRVTMTAQLRAGPTRKICNRGSVSFDNAEGATRKRQSNKVCFDRETPKESPSYSCTNLKSQNSLTGTSPHTVKFNTNYNVSGGANFQKQVYYINGARAGESTTGSFEHRFSEPGEYQIHTVIHTSEGQTAQTENCAVSVSIQPPTASYVCERLLVDGETLGTEKLTTQFKVDYNVANTDLKNLNFFVDSELVASQKNSTYQHTFTEIGTHTVHVILETDAGSTDQSNECSATVSVEETPDESVQEDKTARVITGFNPVTTNDNDDRSASVDGRRVSSGELIEYELKIINSGNTSYDDDKPYTLPAENLVDVLEYANVININGDVVKQQSQYDKPIRLFGGGTLEGGEVTWPEITAFEPGSTIKKSIFVKIKDDIPKTNTPPSDPFSYDCTMSNTYINSSTVNIDVECPPEKVVETTVTSLPNTGPLQTAMLTGGFAMLAFYLFNRNQLLVKELEIIQTEYSGGLVR